ncbi:DNA/RNA polymerase [Daedalea quercina L-15889]|uniref:DNA polymerase eta n=1 Tax=Daedalea quercina L-15889 TaxID=1314783 RepID=A0A165TJ34_9APHY|nr:DNA/RNA polymerase [Daedalea quercina L-15889]
MSSSTNLKPISWRGKGKAADSADVHFNDLNPTITYRQLHSRNLGVKDPLRVIALCDSDAFYAACEQIRLGIDPSRPLVVQQWDSLIAVNYPARKFGITRMEKIKEAKKKCPELVVVHVATYKEGEKEPGYWENPDTLTHKVSLDHYRRESMKVIRMFQEGLPSGEIEKASIDEAFIDFTRPVREEILRRYPDLAQVPPDAPQGPDSPLPPPPPIMWNDLGTVIPVSDLSPESSVTNTGEPNGHGLPDDDNESVDNFDDSITWHDVALAIAAELMGKIRRDIHSKLGYSTSAGIARNKFLAKLTASYKKPNSQSILRNAAIPSYLKPMPFQKIRFLGGKLGKAIAEEYEASTVGDLLNITLEEMQRKFGEESIWVYEILRGIDRSEVKEKSGVNKSMMAAKNLPNPITKPSQGPHWIRVLAAELALRLREAREETPALWPKTLVLHVRLGYDASRSKQAAFPFTRDASVDVIASAGDKLWKELVGADSSRTPPLKITHVALGFTGIEVMEAGQRTIAAFLKPPSTSNQAEGVDVSVKRKRDSRDDVEVTERVVVRRKSGSDSPTVSPDYTASFICDKCSKRISLPEDLMDDGLDDVIKEEALEALRVEHTDFHYAQELSRQLSSSAPPRKFRPSSGEQVATTKKKAPQHDGIARFFAAK